MRVTRSHVDCPLSVGADIALPEGTAAHLLRVLRLQVNDLCVLFNGDGHDYQATISAIGKRDARAQITARRLVENESPLRITLLQGIARGEKMDWILQKATELGVARFLPVQSERSEVKLGAPRSEKRVAHWREVVTAACEQSGRAVIPELSPPQPLEQAASTCHGALFLLDPLAAGSFKELHGSAMTACTLAIGPEGGWSPRDREQLSAAGFTSLNLGPRILRTETAGLAAIAALQMVCGDFA